MGDLADFIQIHSEELYQALRLYVWRAGFDAIDPIAQELLSEVTIEALRHESRFDAARHPMSWILGIAVNLLKRRRQQTRRLDQREPLIRDLVDRSADLDEDEILERLLHPTDPIEQETLRPLLARLSPEDQTLIELAVIHDLNGEAIAAQLGIRPGAARMRLHRALARLRQFYLQQDKETL
ncbi:MAG: sigma-70 family RNA polymerase sigma factor [Anaerolineae bacterium]|jgi:RNA polymerase sigma-70 factor (ECF subfamily)|nr:sigma-70 family RNA polymerase sigma factor [Anaerolineae bacterium]